MTPLILTLVFVLIVAVSALVGFVRGLNKSVIRLMTLVLAIILTFVIAGPVTNLIAESIKIEGATLGEMIYESVYTSNEMIAGILDAAPLMKEAIIVAPAFVIGIVLFPIAFVLLQFITWIVFLCVQKPLRKLIFKDSCKKEDAAKVPTGVRVGKKFAGMGVGLVAGVLVFGMLMAPLFGLFSVLPERTALEQVVDTLEDQGSMDDKTAEFIKTELGLFDSFIVKMSSALGITAAGKSYLGSVSKIEYDGQSTKLTEEFDSLFAVVQTAIEGELLTVLMNLESTDDLYPILSDKEFVDALMQDMFNSKLLRSAIPEVTAIALESAAKSMGVPENKEAVYNNMMDDIATAVKDTEIDYAGIEAYEQANNISYVESVNGVNPREGLMTEEEYKAEIEKLDKLVATITNILNKAVSGGNETVATSVADHIVKGVKKQAVENGTATIENFDANSVKTTISEISSSEVDAGDASADEFLGKLTNPEQFTTNVVTVEDVKASIRETVKAAVADDTKSAETASTLASVVSDFAGAVSSATDESGNIDATKLDFDKVASAVTTLQNSTLKGVGSTVLDIVSSSELGDNEIVNSALSAVKDSYDKGEDVGGTIGAAGALVGLGSAMGGNTDGELDNEAIAKSFTDLVKNLNETTLKHLRAILSTETITSLGVPAEYAEPTFTVVETLLQELMKLKGSEDYENEINAVISIYNLATSGLDKFEQSDISKLVNYAVESDAIFNTLQSVSTSNPFGIKIESETTRADLAKAIEDGYAESGKTARERDIYNAVARMLGIDDLVDLK